MNLNFITHWGKEMGELAGKPTYFVDKICKGLMVPSKHLIIEILRLYEKNPEYYPILDDRDWRLGVNLTPKLTTIREDKNDLWKVGSKIHFTIHDEIKDRFQFAPVIEVKRVQKIRIIHDGDRLVYINDNFWWESREVVEDIALNDGFNSVDDFFKFFNKNFVGKIIHWTDLEY